MQLIPCTNTREKEKQRNTENNNRVCLFCAGHYLAYNLLNSRVPGEGYFRNASCELNSISTVLFTITRSIPLLVDY